MGESRRYADGDVGEKRELARISHVGRNKVAYVLAGTAQTLLIRLANYFCVVSRKAAAVPAITTFARCRPTTCEKCGPGIGL